MRTVVLDIDGTICTQVSGPSPDYSLAEPFPDRIAAINAEFRHCRVVVATARGGTTGINWRHVTELQLRLWGLRYDELIIPKNKHPIPEYDLWIDDKAMNAADLEHIACTIAAL